MSLYPIALDQVAAIQHEVSFNQAANALSKAALFGVRQSKTNGLRLTLYGGNYPSSSGPVHLPDVAINLTPSATNYIYVDSAGVVFKVTSAPSGWPGPIVAGWIALYQLTVGANAITSGTCYLLGPASPGSTGPQGPTGLAGAELYLQRKRVWEAVGSGSSLGTEMGFATASSASTSFTTQAVGSGSLWSSVPVLVLICSNALGASGQFYNAQNLYHLGNAAGRGGFNLSIRWAFDVVYSGAQRSFFGLYNIGAGEIGNVDPSSLLNIIGVGGDAADTNFSIMHNDGSGSATKVALGANFPAISNSNIYELNLSSVANSGVVAYSLTEVVAGNSASGNLSTNLPANTQFLSWMQWVNNIATTQQRHINLIQVVGNGRY